MAPTIPLWWVDPAMDPEALASYFRVLARAEQDLQRDPKRWLPLWKYSIPPSFRDREWDFSRFHEASTSCTSGFLWPSTTS